MRRSGTVLILDEIQSGYGRSGDFFAFQKSGIKPDIITLAKGMGNGFPVGGILISPEFKPRHGMLGTTFGGNYLACAASLAVLEVMESEKLHCQCKAVGDYLIGQLKKIPGIVEIRGRGLMIGVSLTMRRHPYVRSCEQHHIFTGVSSTNVIRLLPPLCLTGEMAAYFIDCFRQVIEEERT